MEINFNGRKQVWVRATRGVFIIDRTHPPWGLVEQKDRPPTHFQMYYESRFDTKHDDGDSAGQLHMVPDVGNERAGEPLKYFRKGVGRPIIKRNKRIKYPHWYTKVDLSWKYTFANMSHSCLNGES